MTFNTIQNFFKFSKEQRNGIAILLAIIVLLQVVSFFADFDRIEKENPDKQKWLSLQSKIDSVKSENHKYGFKIYPFNPNFITDYKGYKLGMSVQEIDRLLDFRKENRYVNSAKEFQNVTEVSDSLLNTIAPFFKFPDWVNHKKEFKEYKNYSNLASTKKEKIIQIDINLATKEELIKVYGIGEAISIRILTQKEKLGGYVSMDQMNDVWGISPEVIANLNARFTIIKLPNINKIDINNASIKELSQFFYFKYELAKQIVKYRSMNGDFKNIEDLIKINGFPADKAKFIALYLDF